MGARKNLNIEQLRWLRNHFPCMSNKELAKHLGICVSTVCYHAELNNLHKTLAYIRDVRRRGAEVTNNRIRRTET